MSHYHIDRQALAIIHGPADLSTTYFRALTGCGNPERLSGEILDLFDIVPAAAAEFDPRTHKPAAPVVYADRVEIGAVALTAEDLAERLVEWRATAVVTQRQARVYLARAGLLASIDAQVAVLGGEAQITWEYSQEVQRLNPFVLALPFTAEQMDQMFRDAALL